MVAVMPIVNAPVAAESVSLFFGELSRPVELIDCMELREHLPLLFPGWHIRPAAGSTLEPVVSLRRMNHEFRLDGFWIDKTLHRPDAISALCALVAEVVRAWVCDGSRFLCLHGAAARLADITLLPAR